jgi:hypothetical protein
MKQKDYSFTRSLFNNLLAGHKSLSRHPFLSDFILVGQKLEQLGLTYY